MLQPGLYQSLPDSQTQTRPWCFHNRLLHISRLVLCAPLRKDPRGYSTRQLPGPLTSAIRGFAPCSLSYSIFLSIFRHSRSYTQIKVGLGCPHPPSKLCSLPGPCRVLHNFTTGLNLILHYISVSGWDS